MTMTSIVRWLLWLMLVFSPMTALAQSYMTTVTAQVKDINGTLYNSCRYSATLVNLSDSTLTLGGTALPDQFKQVTGTQCSANGNLNTRIVSNTALIPNNSQWRFTICDSNGANCFNVQLAITGTTQDITTQVQAAAVILPVTNTTLLAGNNNYIGNNTHSGSETFNGISIFGGASTFNNTVDVNNLFRVSGGNNVAGGLNYITRLSDSAGNAALDILADTQRAGGLRRPPTNLLGLGDRVYIYDNLQIERRIWGDESFALTSKVSPITSTTLAVASAVGDTAITVAATPGSWTVDVEIEFGSLLGGSHETRSITAINGNVLSLNYPLRYIHTIGSTVQRFRWRGAIYPVNTDDLTPNGTLSIGASESALEATSFPETISQETHVSYNSQLASNMLSMIAFGGDTSAGTGMSVNVIGGIATVSGNAGTGSPGFTFQATAQNGVTIAAADPTNPRIDVIYWDLNGVVRVVTGTPAGSPVAPAVPTGGTKLYEVTVPANAVSSASFTFVDKRATYAGWKPADPANNGTHVVQDSVGRYIKCRISGTPTWACGAFDQNNASQPLRIETPLQVGTNGTSITTIVGAAAVLTYGAIAAQTCQEQPLTVANASVTNNGVFASPRASLGSTNLSWSSWVSAAGTVSVRVCNQTAGALTPAAVTWGATVIQ